MLRTIIIDDEVNIRMLLKEQKRLYLTLKILVRQLILQRQVLNLHMETTFKLGETKYFTRDSSSISYVAVRVTLSFHPAVNLMPFHHPAKES